MTNTSVNPARSTGVSLFVGGWALEQLWLFWIGPLVGGVIGALLYRYISADPAERKRSGVQAKPAGWELGKTGT